MTAMPHLSSMIWNHEDELQEVAVGTETVYFQYAGGIRSRKYTEKSGSTTEERIYLGAFEIYRKRVNGTLDLERESLHISDGTGRICIVETKTVDGGSAVGSPVGIWRYQLGNHLGSAATEVDQSGDVISYEEYHPYGTSAYRAVDSSVDVSAKRYRYTGMERDEETALAYHSARYYVPWLGRWSAADPIGVVDDANRYRYVKANPVLIQDPDGQSGWFADATKAIGEGARVVKDSAAKVVKDSTKLAKKSLKATSKVLSAKDEEELKAAVQEISQDVGQSVTDASRAVGRGIDELPETLSQAAEVLNKTAEALEHFNERASQVQVARKPAADYTVSPEAIDFIASWEGNVLKLYNDSAGKCTIGVGHLVHDGPCGSNPEAEAPFKNGITEEQSLKMFTEEDVPLKERQLKSKLEGVDLTQGEYDALLSWAFNLGHGRLNKDTTFYRDLLAGDHDKVPDSFWWWRNAGNAPSEGLTRRRFAEIWLWKTGEAIHNKDWTYGAGDPVRGEVEITLDAAGRRP